MELLRDAALVFGLVSNCAALITVTLPGLRKKAVEVLLRLTGANRQGEEIARIGRMLEKHVQDDEARRKEMELQKEVDLCVLRDLITGIYYQYADQKRIPVYALRDAAALHDLYRRRGGNSYEGILFRRMTREWEVIPSTEKEEL